MNVPATEKGTKLTRESVHSMDFRTLRTREVEVMLVHKRNKTNISSCSPGNRYRSSRTSLLLCDETADKLTASTVSLFAYTLWVQKRHRFSPRHATSLFRPPSERLLKTFEQH